MTSASLGFKIDSSQASSAAVDLEKLYAAASKMDAAADSLTTSAGALAGALKRVGDETKKVPPVAKPFQDQDDHVRAFRAEIERLTVKYQPLAQATQRYEASISEINRAHQLGIISAQQMQKALDGERLAFERLKTSAMTASQAVKAANANVRGGGNERASGINAGYQVQDVVVSALGGQSAGLIGFQQGTQLAAAISTMERPVAGLAAAFGSMINPVTLVTIGLTAGVSALIQYFTTASDGAEEFEQKFAKQAEMVQNVAARWGDAYPALKAYSDELARTADQAELQAGVTAATELRFREMGKALDLLVQIGPDVSRALRDITSQEGAQAALAYQEAIHGMRTALEAGKDPSQDFAKATAALATIIEDSGSKALRDYGEQFDILARKIGEATNQTQAFKLQLPDLGTLAAPWSEGGRLFFPEQFTPRTPGTPSRRPLIELDGLPGSQKTEQKEENVYKRAMEAAREQVEVLQLQAKTAGEAGIAADVLRFRLDLLHRSFKDGKQATADQTAEIDNLTASYKAAAEAAAKAKFAADIAFQSRQLQRTSRDQQIANTLRGYGFSDDLGSGEADIVSRQLQWAETKDSVKAFFTDFQSALQESGGDIGEAFANALRNGIMNVANKLATQAIDQLSTAATNWLTGALGKGAGPVAAGFNPTTTLGALLSAGGKAANDNSSAATNFPTTDIAAYIRQSALKHGIDPNIALRVAKSEGGLDSWNLQSNFVKNGVREPSFGPFQLYKGGGLGNVFQKQTGMDPADASSGPAGVDFALNHASKNGWGSWYGAKKVGIDNFEGIGKATESIDKLGDAATKTASITSGMGDNLGSGLSAAAEGLGKLGSGLGSFGQQVAQIAAGGGASSGGGAFGFLGKLFGGISPTSSFWAPNTTLGSFLVNGFANGTNNAPGGMSIVGERGPELLNIPQGSGVMSNHKLMNALNENGGKSQAVNIRVDVSGARGNSEIEDMVSKGVRQGIQHYDRSQAGRTAVKAVQSYQERFG